MSSCVYLDYMQVMWVQSYFTVIEIKRIASIILTDELTTSLVIDTDCIDTTRPSPIILRRVWRYQRGNQNPYIEEEQTTQWPKEKVQKDKQWSTKHTYKTKDRVTRTPLKTGGELRCSSSCSTSDTRRVNLVTNSVISHELGDNRSGNQEWTIQRYWQH
jgi:hypothetical protein